MASGLIEQIRAPARGGLEQRASASHLALILLLCLLLYRPGLNASYFGDDFKYLFVNPREHILTEFVRPNPGNPVFWRPIQSTLLAVQQVFLGQATWPCQLLQVIMHCGLVLTVHRLGRQLGMSSTQCLLAAAFVALGHASVQSVVGVDTLSQTGSTLFLTLGALHLMMASDPDLPPARGFLWRALAMGEFGLAMVMKETGVAGLPVLGLLACVGLFASKGPFVHRRPLGRRNHIQTVGTLLALVLVFLIYLAWRGMVVEQNTGHQERYGISLGMNVPRNVLLLMGLVLLPVSAHRIILWDDFGGPLPAVAVGVGVLVCGVMLIGLRLVSWRLMLGIVTILVLSCFPAALIGQATEVYAYHLIPPAALLLGLVAGALADLQAGTRRGSVLAVLVVAFFGLNAWALHEKVQLMTANGAVATDLRRQVIALIRAAPADSQLVLVDEDAGRRHYSVLITPGLLTLSSAWPGILMEADRPDVTLARATELSEDIKSGTFVYKVTGQMIVPHP